MRANTEVTPVATRASSEAWRIASIALWLFLSLTLLYVALTRGHFVGTDEIAVYQATRSLWESSDLHTGRIVNTARGRAGLDYSVFSAGQSFAALPLYGVAKTVAAGLQALESPDWIQTFAGPQVGTEPSRWGGDITIFFVGLYGAFPVAALCALFFAFSLRLGASVRASLASALFLGLATYVAPAGTSFLQHGSEALFLLWTFYFLFRDAQQPRWQFRMWAGITLALSLALRWESAIAVPWLGLYLLWSIWERREASGGIVRGAVEQVPPFALPLLAGLSFPLIINWIKFESIWGVYGNVGFNSPFPTGLYTFLFSSGDSMFIYTPLLLLLAWIVPPFARRWGREAVLIAAISLFYLFFYASYRHWHGLWSDLGPRFLLPLIPFLLLPLAGWMDTQRPRVWLVVGPLALIGVWVQFVHVAANFSYVSYYEHFIVPIEQQIPWDMLFVPERAPILAHSRATLAWDYRVDLWLVWVTRTFGVGRFLLVALPLAALLGGCVWRLVTYVRTTEAVLPAPEELDFSLLARPVGLVLGGIVLLTVLAMTLTNL